MTGALWEAGLLNRGGGREREDEKQLNHAPSSGKRELDLLDPNEAQSREYKESHFIVFIAISP